MHALVGVWSAAPGMADTQRQELDTKIVPMVRSLPGFVQGYWTEDAETGRLHSFIVFDDEAGARFLKGVVEGNSQAQARVGISYDSLSVVEVKASASRKGGRGGVAVGLSGYP